MDDVLTVLGKCFNKKYIPDLVERHTTSSKSQYMRIRGQKPTPNNQLNTIKLRARPLKAPGVQYARKLNLSGKTILVIDDFCTGGYTLEAVRLYLEEAGAIVKCATWLKTINTDYESLSIAISFNPYGVNEFQDSDVSIRRLGYRGHITDNDASSEMTKMLKNYL